MSNKTVLMLVDNYIPFDTRVWQESCALRDNGYNVKIICQHKHGQPKGKVIEDGITIIRLNKNQKFNGVLGYVWEYSTWISKVFYKLLFEKFDIIHTANPPDFYFPITFFYKILGKKIVFDHHDLCPELYLSRLGSNKGFFYKLLMLSEKISVKLADLIIATNESYKEININRNNINKNKIVVVRNAPDLNRLKIVEKDNFLRKTKYLIGYIGNINPQDGVDRLLLSIKYFIETYNIKDILFIIIGHGDSVQDLIKQSKEFEIDKYIMFTGRLNNESVNRILSTVDICVAPDPHNPLNESFTSTKIMEYMFYGKPIVAYDLKETIYSAGASAFYAKNEYQFADYIHKLITDKKLANSMGIFGKHRVENELNWNKSKTNLIKGYNNCVVKKND